MHFPTSSDQFTHWWIRSHHPNFSHNSQWNIGSIPIPFVRILHSICPEHALIFKRQRWNKSPQIQKIQTGDCRTQTPDAVSWLYTSNSSECSQENIAFNFTLRVWLGFFLANLPIYSDLQSLIWTAILHRNNLPLSLCLNNFKILLNACIVSFIKGNW